MLLELMDLALVFLIQHHPAVTIGRRNQVSVGIQNFDIRDDGVNVLTHKQQ